MQLQIHADIMTSAIFTSVNPYTGDVIERYPIETSAQTAVNVDELDCGYRTHRRTSLKTRALALRRMSDILERDRLRFSAGITHEMGKLTGEALAEIHKCADLCRYYADCAEELLEGEAFAFSDVKARAILRPIGPILAVMPWNFPFWQAFRCIAPNILLGNVIALKHAPNVQGCAADIAGVVAEASPDICLLKNFRINNETTAKLIADSRIVGVTLTGSERAGAAVAKTAGEHLKKTVLELGGSDAYVVLDDADVELAAETCVKSRMINAGQSCIAAKRFIVDKKIYNGFVELVAKKMRAYVTGNPEDKNVTLAPLMAADRCKALQATVDESLALGAEAVVGGKYDEGAFYPATLLTGVTSDMPCAQDETFGPVAAVMKASDETHAAELANATSYGLGGAVFSRDEKRAVAFAENALETGGCAVNDMLRSYPQLPFGGVKHSGYGRELAREGVREFANVKTIITGA